MQRRAVFTDLDKLGFEEQATIVPVEELHLDESQLSNNLAVKTEVVQLQAEKKKHKKKKNKGLRDFMDNEKQAFDSYKNVD